MEEGQNREYKRSLSDISSILETIVAFANNGGGEVFIGIDEKKGTVGVDIGKNTIENLALAISKNIEPALLPDIVIESIDEKKIIKIKVKESRIKPHFYKSIAYKRVGKTNITLNPQEIEEIISSRIKSLDFDETVSEATLNDIDKNALEKFRELVKQQKRIPDTNLSDKLLFEKLELLKGKYLKNAAVFLFAENPSRFFPFFSFKCAVSKTHEFDLDQLMDIQSLELPFFLLVDEIVDYIIRYIPKRIYLEGVRRMEDPMIPKDALREVVINSLIHRDFQTPSPNYLLITPDFIEVRNPGGLPHSLTVADLYRIHNSVLRNDLMARTVYCAGYMDKWGSGTTKIVSECGTFGIIPEFINEKNFFRVKIPFKPPEDALKIISILKNGKIGSAAIARKLKIAERTARKLLSDLVKKRIIRRTRHKKRVYYEI